MNIRPNRSVSPGVSRFELEVKRVTRAFRQGYRKRYLAHRQEYLAWKRGK